MINPRRARAGPTTDRGHDRPGARPLPCSPDPEYGHTQEIRHPGAKGTIMPSDRPKPTTTDAGIPVPSDEHSLTVGPDGPILLQDHYLIEQMANFNRERIPERQP